MKGQYGLVVGVSALLLGCVAPASFGAVDVGGLIAPGAALPCDSVLAAAMDASSRDAGGAVAHHAGGVSAASTGTGFGDSGLPTLGDHGPFGGDGALSEYSFTFIIQPDGTAVCTVTTRIIPAPPAGAAVVFGTLLLWRRRRA